MKKMAGFTLIEMMIVVAILGILGSIAYPSYMNSVRKSRRTDAIDALSHAAALQERWYLQNNQYAATANIDSIGGAASEEGYYAITTAFTMNGTDCSADSDRRCFTVTATAQNSQLDDEGCRFFTIDNLGRKRARDSSGAETEDCW